MWVVDERKREDALPWSCFSGLGRLGAELVDAVDFGGFFDEDGPGLEGGGGGGCWISTN